MRPALGFRSYLQGDFDEIEPHCPARTIFWPPEKWSSQPWPACAQAALRWHQPPNDPALKAFTWTVTREDRPIACGGINLNIDYDRYKLVWTAWIYVGNLSSREWRFVIGHAFDVLAKWDRKIKNPIDAPAPFENKAALRILYRLGFVHESGGFTHGDKLYVRRLREAA